jgi:hypothetical protein
MDGIRMDIEDIGGEVKWFKLAQDRDQWRAFVNVVMNLRVFPWPIGDRNMKFGIKIDLKYFYK